MLARHYNRKIEIWKNESVSDGYGGHTMQQSKVSSIWTNIQTSAGNRFESFGISDFKQPTVFRVRGHKNLINYDENTFVRFGLKEYVIRGIENVGIDDMEYNLYCDER